MVRYPGVQNILGKFIRLVLHDHNYLLIIQFALILNRKWLIGSAKAILYINSLLSNTDLLTLPIHACITSRAGFIAPPTICRVIHCVNTFPITIYQSSLATKRACAVHANIAWRTNFSANPAVITVSH